MKEYPAKPLETWEKVREIRRQLFWDIWKAPEEGRLVIQGLNPWLTSLCAGLGDRIYAVVSPNFGRISSDLALMTKCHEIAEARGFKADTCAFMRLNIGSLYSGTHFRNPRTGGQIKPDFCLSMVACPHQPKGDRVFRDYYKIPHLIVEVPPYTQPIPESYYQYFVSQTADAIEYIERELGRKYDDEKLIEAVYTEWHNAVLYAKICNLIKAIPAPIDMMRLGSYLTPLVRVGRESKMVTEVFQMLLDELEDRVQNGIGIEAIQNARLFHDGLVPWYYMNLNRLARKYGALIIGGTDVFSVAGAFSAKEDGTWEAKSIDKVPYVPLRGEYGCPSTNLMKGPNGRLKSSPL